MLSAKLRLSAKDVERFFSVKKNALRRKAYGGFVIMYDPNMRSYNRFAVVFPKKLLQSAVVRNRSKRRVKAVLYKHRENIIGGFDIVLLFRERIDTVSQRALEEIVVDALKKANIYKK